MCNRPFYNVTLLIFSFKQKMSLAARFIMANLVNTQSLIRIRCELKKIWELGNHGMEIHAREQAFLNISKFSVPYFHFFATDVSETSFLLTLCSSVLCKAVPLRLQSNAKNKILLNSYPNL